MTSTTNQRAPRKLIDYTQQGKQMDKVYVAGGASFPRENIESSFSFNNLAQRELSACNSIDCDSIQFPLDWFLRARHECQPTNGDPEQVEFMLKIPCGFSARTHSDLRERFPTTSTRRSKSLRRNKRIESALSEPLPSRRLTRRTSLARSA